MSLSASLKPLFSSGDRNRGASYHRSQAVHSMEVEDGILVAEVAGSDRDYVVTLDLSDEEEIFCTCPRFEDGYLCKHIWATILQYESAQGRQGLASSNIASRTQKKKGKQIPQWQSLLNQVSPKSFEFASASKSPFQSATAQQAEVHYVIDASEGSRIRTAHHSTWCLRTCKESQWRVGEAQAAAPVSRFKRRAGRSNRSKDLSTVNGR